MNLSRRAYAKHRKDRGLVGGSLQAVQRALAGERIHLEADGLIDPERADREWAINTDHTEASAAVVERAARGGDTGEVSPVFDVVEVVGPVSGSATQGQAPQLGATLAENNAVKVYWQAKQAELDYLEAAGKLVPAAQVQAGLEHAFQECKTKLLTIPSQAKMALGLEPGQVLQLEDLLRDALGSLAARASWL